MADVTDTLAPKSDQLDAIELAGGARTFTVAQVDVRKGAEQPISVHLAEFPRPWKPGVTMRRVLAHCWGKDSDGWIGKRVALYYEPSITYGKEKPGGTRISHLSHIDGPTDVPVLLSQGRPGKYPVQPLPDDAPTTPDPSPDEVAACTDPATLRSWWQTSSPATRELINARGAALKADPTP